MFISYFVVLKVQGNVLKKTNLKFQEIKVISYGNRRKGLKVLFGWFFLAEIVIMYLFLCQSDINW
jgi:hypothetical protein